MALITPISKPGGEPFVFSQTYTLVGEGESYFAGLGVGGKNLL